MDWSVVSAIFSYTVVVLRTVRYLSTVDVGRSPSLSRLFKHQFEDRITMNVAFKGHLGVLWRYSDTFPRLMTTSFL